MSAVPMSADAERASARRYTFLGGALIALAFAGPALATPFGIGTAYSVGQDLVRTLSALVVAAFISWLITKNRSDLAKAKARVVVGVLLCVSVGTGIADSARDAQLAKQFYRDSISFSELHGAKFDALTKRFEQVNVMPYLTPEGLVSAPRIAAGQAVLERYRSLLAERNLLLQAYLSEYTAFVSALPSGQLRDGAEAGMAPARKATEDLYRILDTTQTAHANAMGAVFDWAQANLGKVSIKGEQMMFQTREQQAELVALGNKLQEAENTVNAAVEKAQGEKARAEAKRSASIKEMEALLGKK